MCHLAVDHMTFNDYISALTWVKLILLICIKVCEQTDFLVWFLVLIHCSSAFHFWCKQVSWTLWHTGYCANGSHPAQADIEHLLICRQWKTERLTSRCPLKAAWCRAVRPARSDTLTLLSKGTNASAQRTALWDTATCSGVCQLLSLAFTSAECFSNTCTASWTHNHINELQSHFICLYLLFRRWRTCHTSLQEATARWRGVSHLLSLAFTLAPERERERERESVCVWITLVVSQLKQDTWSFPEACSK